MSLKDIFSGFHSTNRWRSDESISGPGSEIGHTSLLRVNLDKLLSKYKFESILDVPCGDYNWIKEVNLHGATYIGGDIVPKLIEDNKLKYPDVDFRVINIVDGDLPKSGVILVRDCLVHLSNDNVKKALENIKNSGSKYLLTTSHIENKIEISQTVNGDL